MLNLKRPSSSPLDLSASCAEAAGASAYQSVPPLSFAPIATFMLITVKNAAGVVPGSACARKPSCAVGWCWHPGVGWVVSRALAGTRPGVGTLEVT